MIASIGPFWDANETWLVLGIGILLIAFPLRAQHDFIKFIFTGNGHAGRFNPGAGSRSTFALKHRKTTRNYGIAVFQVGSLLATLAQGYMLGLFVMGFEDSLGCAFICRAQRNLCDGRLYLYRRSLAGNENRRRFTKTRRMVGTSLRVVNVTLGIIAVSIVNPLVSDIIFDKWFGSTLWLLSYG